MYARQESGISAGKKFTQDDEVRFLRVFFTSYLEVIPLRRDLGSLRVQREIRIASNCANLFLTSRISIYFKTFTLMRQ